MTKAQARKRIAAYIRVSRVMGRAGDSFLSPDIQLNTIKQWADAKYGVGNWLLVEVFRDMDESGTSMDRGELNRAIEEARAGKFDVVAVYDLSRWARNVAEGLAELRALERIGVQVLSASEIVDVDTPEGTLNVTMMLAFHEYRAGQAAKSWQATIERQGQLGRHHGKASFGYRRAESRVGPDGQKVPTGELVPDEDDAPVLVEIFERFASGEPPSRIEDDLKRRGHPLMRVTRIVANPIYIGKVIRREHKGTAERQMKRSQPDETRTAKRRRLAHEEASRSFTGEGVRVYSGRHEPLVSMVLWERTQARLAERRANRIKESRYGPAHPLARIAVCDHCDMSLVQQRDKRRGTVNLRDNNGKRWRDCRGVGQVHRGDLEAAVRREVTRIADLWASDIASAQTNTHAQRAKVLREIERYERRTEVLTEKLVALALNRVETVGGDEVYTAAAAKVEREREGVRKHIEELRDSLPTTPTLDAVAGLRSLAESWDSLSTEDLHRTIRSWITQVRVRYPDFPGQPVGERITVVP